MKRIVLPLLSFASLAASVPAANDSPREWLLMESNWHFALGHATDETKDFGCVTGRLSFFAKKDSDRAHPLPTSMIARLKIRIQSSLQRQSHGD